MMGEKVKESQSALQKEKEAVKNLLPVISDPATTPKAIGHITTGQHLLAIPYLLCLNRNNSALPRPRETSQHQQHKTISTPSCTAEGH